MDHGRHRPCAGAARPQRHRRQHRSRRSTTTSRSSTSAGAHVQLRQQQPDRRDGQPQRATMHGRRDRRRDDQRDGQRRHRLGDRRGQAAVHAQRTLGRRLPGSAFTATTTLPNTGAAPLQQRRPDADRAERLDCAPRPRRPRSPPSPPARPCRRPGTSPLPREAASPGATSSPRRPRSSPTPTARDGQRLRPRSRCPTRR